VNSLLIAPACLLGLAQINYMPELSRINLITSWARRSSILAAGNDKLSALAVEGYEEILSIGFVKYYIGAL